MAKSVIERQAEAAGVVPPEVQVAPSPHLSDSTFTTRRMMTDVILALVPAMIAALVVFQWYSVKVVGLCVLTALAAEAVFNRMRGRSIDSIYDGSAAVTGIILGLSLPWSAPWYVPVVGSVIAIGIGKAMFGGLGYNMFNPAMVGRAFVMLSFAKALGASAYVNPEASLAALTQATPLTAAKAAAGQAGLELWPLFLGNVNGSLGETSALALLIGGVYLCWRRSADWRIPAAVIVSTFLLGGLANLTEVSPIAAHTHLLAGSLLFGAFFIATDPVSSPLTPWAKVIFGAGIGFFVVLLRVFSSYPEGVMFAVLLMNGLVPLFNRLTVPRPLGGPAPEATQQG